MKHAIKHFVVIVVCVLRVPGCVSNVDVLRRRSIRDVPRFVVLL